MERSAERIGGAVVGIAQQGREADGGAARPADINLNVQCQGAPSA